MILKAQFCCGQGDGRGDLHTFESSDMEGIKKWAEDLSDRKGFHSVFMENFQVHCGDLHQWGTGYYWLEVRPK